MDFFEFELTGVMPLLMHNDNIVGAQQLEDWRKDPGNKTLTKPGDDRSPPWTWHTYLYSDGERVVVPAQNVMGALRYAGASFRLSGQKTLRGATQSGLVIMQEYCPLLVGGAPVAVADVYTLRDLDFDGQLAGARKLGFDLEVKRLKMPGQSSKHIRVRPKFDHWAVSGQVQVRDPAFTPQVLTDLFQYAGKYSGLLDWRPSARSPGPCGVFEARVTPARAPARKKTA